MVLMVIVGFTWCHLYCGRWRFKYALLYQVEGGWRPLADRDDGFFRCWGDQFASVATKESAADTKRVRLAIVHEG